MTKQSTIEDTELVALAIEDSSYFSELVFRYEKPLMRYVRRIGYFEVTEVEDILQDTFLKVYKNLNGYNPELKFSSWIYRITHSVTIDFLRKKSVRPEGNYTPVDDQFVSRISSELSTDGETMSAETVAHISAAIDTLKGKYRDTVILYYFEDKSYEEISDVLEIPINTVATRLRRAKEALKEELTSKEIYE